MKSRWSFLPLALAVLLPAVADAQPPIPRPLPTRGASPLLHVRFYGSPTLQVTLFPGSGPARTFNGPITAGFRPGYIYRVKLSGFPDHPDLVLFPTLEVRGTLCLPPNLNPADYPAP